MSGLLLDSHVILWWLMDRPMARDAEAAIADPVSRVTISMASIWELAIKQGLGRLDVPEHYVEVLVAQGAEVLGINLAHTMAYGQLPLLHRDPFDRMLVAQAQVERLTLVTRDEQLMAYDVATLQA